MALTANERQLCEYALVLEQMVGAWEQVRANKDIPYSIDSQLHQLDGQRQAAAAKCADSLAAFKAQQ